MADFLSRLAVLITGDSRGAVKAFQETAVTAQTAAEAEARFAVAGDKVAVAEAQVALAAAKSAKDVEATAVATANLSAARSKLAASSAEAKLVSAQGELQAAEKGLTGVTQQASVAQRALQAVGLSGAGSGLLVAGGATAAAAALLKFADSASASFARVTGQVLDFQRVSGATAEDASKLVYAFNVLGVDSDAAGKAMFRLGREAESGGATLAAVGVNVAHTAKGAADLSATFANVADAVQRVGPGAQADAIAFAAFGRQGAALLPVLLQGRAALEGFYAEAAKSHQVYSQADIDKGREFTVKTHELAQEMTGLRNEAGSALVPFITSVSEATKNVLQLGDALAKVKPEWAKDDSSFQKFLKKLGLNAFDASAGWKALDKAQKDTASSAGSAADAEKAAAASLDQAATSAEAEATALSGANSALLGMLDSEQAVADAKDAVAAAQQKVVDAEQAGAAKQAEVDKATRALAQSQNSVADAQERLNQAERDAPLNVDKARNAEAEAADAVAQAMLDETVAIEKYGRGTVQAKKAADDLAKARLDAAGAANATIDATNGKTVLDAQQALTDAKQAEADAQTNVNKAQAVDPVTEMTAAKKDLDSAERNLATAVLNEGAAIDNLDKKMADGSLNRQQFLDDLKKTAEFLSGSGVDQAFIDKLTTLGQALTVATAPPKPDDVAGLVNAGVNPTELYPSNPSITINIDGRSAATDSALAQQAADEIAFLMRSRF